MEDALVQRINATTSEEIKVLILVLMEDALVQLGLSMILVLRICLNPCFNGRCTRTE